MQISKIERQKKNPQRYSIFIQDEYAFGVDEQILLKFSIHKGMSLNQDLITKILQAEFQQSVFLKALNYLSYGLRSEKEMRDYLKKLPILKTEDLDTEKLFKMKPPKQRSRKKHESNLGKETSKKSSDSKAEENDKFSKEKVKSASLRLQPSKLKLAENEIIKKQKAEELIRDIEKYQLNQAPDNQETTFSQEQEAAVDPRKSTLNHPIDKTELKNSIIETAIAKLKDQNLIDDRIYGEAYLRTQANINRKGPHNIGNELRRKGLDPFLIEDILTIYDPDQMQENLYEVAEKFVRTKKLPEKMLKMKLQQHLIQKGYPKEVFNDFLQTFQVAVAEEEETTLLNKEAEKSIRKRRRKLAGYELRQKVFQDLMLKGFDYSLIKNWLEDHQTEFETDNSF